MRGTERGKREGETEEPAPEECMGRGKPLAATATPPHPVPRACLPDWPQSY